MLSYTLSDDLSNVMNDSNLIVHSYNVDDKKNRLSVICLDLVNNKALRVVFDNFKITDETFEIEGKTIIGLTLHRYVRYFKSSYFVGDTITISHDDQIITIIGDNNDN